MSASKYHRPGSNVLNRAGRRMAERLQVEQSGVALARTLWERAQQDVAAARAALAAAEKREREARDTYERQYWLADALKRELRP